MGSGASKASSKASTPRKESEEPVSSAVEPTSEPVSEPISEPEPASEPVSEPISAPTEAADEAQTAEEVSQVKYFGFIGGPDQSKYFKAQDDTTQVETEQKSEVTEATEGPDGDASEAIGMFQGSQSSIGAHDQSEVIKEHIKILI